MPPPYGKAAPNGRALSPSGTGNVCLSCRTAPRKTPGKFPAGRRRRQTSAVRALAPGGWGFTGAVTCIIMENCIKYGYDAAFVQTTSREEDEFWTRRILNTFVSC